MTGDSGLDSRCHCGHPHSAHQHFRGGTECAICPDCPRYRSADGLLGRLTAFLFRRSKS